MGNGLAGQTVLVLGGRHLGTAIADAATAEGAKVHVASHRPGGLHIDLRDEATIAAAAAELGPVDHLVNTAAAPHAAPVRELDRERPSTPSPPRSSARCCSRSTSRSGGRCCCSPARSAGVPRAEAW
ncbi:hypothetical protein [Amycolatopsis orientalis]|uniref:hypothetical protein n=1 Tax=Amycolatopsis orientalis TaxID=31958 RepID=UPI000399B2E9|nr:hypothetical protein [Amycolatopsis orientalis]